jgi:hypothetical protein
MTSAHPPQQRNAVEAPLCGHQSAPFAASRLPPPLRAGPGRVTSPPAERLAARLSPRIPGARDASVTSRVTSRVHRGAACQQVAGAPSARPKSTRPGDVAGQRRAQPLQNVAALAHTVGEPPGRGPLPRPARAHAGDLPRTLRPRCPHETFTRPTPDSQSGSTPHVLLAQRESAARSPPGPDRTCTGSLLSSTSSIRPSRSVGKNRAAPAWRARVGRGHARMRAEGPIGSTACRMRGVYHFCIGAV